MSVKSVGDDWLRDSGRTHPEWMEALLDPDLMEGDVERLYKSGEDPLECCSGIPGRGDIVAPVGVEPFRSAQGWNMEVWRLGLSKDATLVALALPGHHYYCGPAGNWVKSMALGLCTTEQDICSQIEVLWHYGLVTLRLAPASVSKRPKTRSNKTAIPKNLRWEVWERDNFTCKHCGTRKNLSVDHVYPESRGGETALGNLQTLCTSCNSRKGASVPDLEPVA